jgi:hypothetical protein
MAHVSKQQRPGAMFARLRRVQRPQVGVDARQRAATQIARSSPAGPHIRFWGVGAPVGRRQSADTASPSRSLIAEPYSCRCASHHPQSSAGSKSRLSCRGSRVVASISVRLVIGVLPGPSAKEKSTGRMPQPDA